MLRNYLLTAARFFLKNKLITAINILGLAIGITCAILVFLYVQFDLSVDRFHKKIDRLYNLILVGESKDIGSALEYRRDIKSGLAEHLHNVYPEIINAARLMHWAGKIEHNNRHIHENRVWFCDPQIFNVLTLPLRRGNTAVVLAAPNSIVITPDMASKYFGEADPIGQTLTILMHWFPVRYTFTVTGILEALPVTSSYRIDFLAHIPFDRLEKDIQTVSRNPEASAYAEIFVELANPAVRDSLQEKLTEIEVRTAYQSMNMKNMVYHLEPFKHAYLTSKATYFEPNASPYITSAATRTSDIPLLILVSSLGLTILIVSCINIINLATAQANLRIGEIGVRKVMGAQRRQLIMQFITESTLLSYMALVIALLLTELLLPYFNTMIHRELAVDYTRNWVYFIGVLCIATITGILSGMYPAFFLSAFKPVSTLKGTHLSSSALLRKGLMIVQIGVCVAVFLFPMVMLKEIDALKARDIGFNPDNLIFFQVEDQQLAQRYSAFRNEILRIPGVTQMTASNFVPWQFGFMLSFSFYNGTIGVRSQALSVDTAFMDTYQIALVDGKKFRTELVENTGRIIVNETAYEMLQTAGNDPLSKSVGISSASYLRHRVQGVMQDFYCFYPTEPIKPLVLMPSRFLRLGREYMTIRLADSGNTEVIGKIEKTVKRFFPKSPFEYKNVAREMDKMHATKLGYRWTALVFATGFALFISGVGLFGFAAYETERCTKEIGVRKALGAKPIQIAMHFILRFSRLTLVANVISWPICYLTIHQILRCVGYPHPVDISLTYFLNAGVLTLGLTTLTVWIQTYRAALADPVKALKYE